MIPRPILLGLMSTLLLSGGGCSSSPPPLPPVVTPTGPTIVKVPVMPVFNLDLVPCAKVGGGSLDTDLDAVTKGLRAQVRADCNAGKLEAAQKALDAASQGGAPDAP